MLWSANASFFLSDYCILGDSKSYFVISLRSEWVNHSYRGFDVIREQEFDIIKDENFIFENNIC